MKSPNISYGQLFSIAAICAGAIHVAPAHAVLTYYIYESGSDVIVEASGSLSGLTASGTASCGFPASISSFSAAINVCTGSSAGSLPSYSITGPSTFNGTVLNQSGAFITPSIDSNLNGGSNLFALSPTYVQGTPIVSSSRFTGTSLTGLGFTTTGLIGTWTLTSGGDTINAVVGSAPPTPSTAAPGPLPLLGAGAAFLHSRRLRRRIQRNPVTTQQPSVSA